MSNQSTTTESNLSEKETPQEVTAFQALILILSLYVLVGRHY
ncbi:hypothetical protein QUF63_17640 [Anaerolineales bacterium HSG25]|nr:hypothetical protein [Anaerolineales bacterium HSG25]